LDAVEIFVAFGMQSINAEFAGVRTMFPGGGVATRPTSMAVGFCANRKVGEENRERNTEAKFSMETQDDTRLLHYRLK
jgi:hypothetical protein